MRNIFIFSESLRSFGKYLKFQFLKFKRWISIYFKKDRELSKVSFDYYKNWQFAQGLLVIDFEFENAVWYKIGSYKSVDFRKPIILNLHNVKSEIIQFEVYGFSQKQTLNIHLNKELEIDNKSFKTNISNFSDSIIIPNQIRLSSKLILKQQSESILKLKAPNLKLKEVSVKSIEIQIKHPKFKTQDYI